MKLTSFRIPEDLHQRIKVYVAKEGMTMQGFLRKAIELYLMKLATRAGPLDGQIATPENIDDCYTDDESNAV